MLQAIYLSGQHKAQANTSVLHHTLLNNTLASPLDLTSIVTSNRDRASDRSAHPDTYISHARSSLKKIQQANNQILSAHGHNREAALFPTAQQRQLISSAVRSRRYKRDDASSKRQSPKSLFTRK